MRWALFVMCLPVLAQGCCRATVVVRAECSEVKGTILHELRADAALAAAADDAASTQHFGLVWETDSLVGANLSSGSVDPLGQQAKGLQETLTMTFDRRQGGDTCLLRSHTSSCSPCAMQALYKNAKIDVVDEFFQDCAPWLESADALKACADFQEQFFTKERVAAWFDLSDTAPPERVLRSLQEQDVGLLILIIVLLAFGVAALVSGVVLHYVLAERKRRAAPRRLAAEDAASNTSPIPEFGEVRNPDPLLVSPHSCSVGSVASFLPHHGADPGEVDTAYVSLDAVE
eukprot:Rhum_TRINITY_DN11657_c0_g2::Rhum_TRINITY_DN11657_c0_g2_i1::g.45988::m.45988